jgi:hypothetical protein
MGAEDLHLEASLEATGVDGLRFTDDGLQMNTPAYDLQGRKYPLTSRLSPLTSKIIIQNGKKFILK